VSENGSANFDASSGYETMAVGDTILTEVTYTVSDGNGGSDTATVQVTVNGQNDAVLAVEDQFAVNEDHGLLVLNVMDNDSAFVAGDVAFVSAVNGDAANVGQTIIGTNGGLFSINADGSATFDTNGEYDHLTENDTLTTSVTYTIEGFGGETSTSTITVDIQGANTAPVAGDDFATVDAGSNGGIANLVYDYVNGLVDGRLLSNDTDAEGNAITVTHVNGQALVNGSITVTGSNGGVFTVLENGTANFDASTGFESLAVGETALTEVTYTVSDIYGASDTAIVQVTINGLNDAPIAVDDSVSTDENSTITIDLLSNDTDLDGNALTVSNLDTSNLLGSLTDNGDGTVSYDTNSQFDALNDGDSALDWFEYTIDDGFGGFDTAQVQINIAGSTANPVSAPAESATPTGTEEETTPPSDFMA
jgi:VCBS repeat-containing protein